MTSVKISMDVPHENGDGTKTPWYYRVEVSGPPPGQAWQQAASMIEWVLPVPPEPELQAPNLRCSARCPTDLEGERCEREAGHPGSHRTQCGTNGDLCEWGEEPW